VHPYEEVAYDLTRWPTSSRVPVWENRAAGCSDVPGGVGRPGQDPAWLQQCALVVGRSSRSSGLPYRWQRRRVIAEAQRRGADVLVTGISNIMKRAGGRSGPGAARCGAFATERLAATELATVSVRGDGQAAPGHSGPRRGARPFIVR